MQEHVKREKQIMAECNNPFLVKLVPAFNEGPYLYLLIECIMGGELFTYLQVQQRTSETCACSSVPLACTRGWRGIEGTMLPPLGCHLLRL